MPKKPSKRKKKAQAAAKTALREEKEVEVPDLSRLSLEEPLRGIRLVPGEYRSATANKVLPYTASAAIVHPKTLQWLGVHVGQVCSLTASETRRTVVMWVDPSLPVGDVLTQLPLSDEDASLQPLESPPQPAMSLNLIVCDDTPASTRKAIVDLVKQREYLFYSGMPCDLFAMGEFGKLVMETPYGKQDCVYRVMPWTTIHVKTNASALEAEIPLGGLDEELQRVTASVEAGLFQQDRFHQHGLDPPKGLLIHGPHGSGKTVFLKRIAATFSHINVIQVKSAMLMSSFEGETLSRINTIFKEAQGKPRSLILIDDIDQLCPERTKEADLLQHRIVAYILTTLDGVQRRTNSVFVVATATKADKIDPALRRPGRLDTEIFLGVPNQEQRAAILEVLLQEVPHTAEVPAITAKTHGFVGSDLEQLVREAGIHAARNKQTRLTSADFTAALNNVKPSSLREMVVEVPHVQWDDVGGQTAIKQRLKEAVEWPLKHADAFKRMGIRPPRGVLMFGPPGTGKTLLAKAMATESAMNFIVVKGPELLSKWVGESEKAVRNVFVKARGAAPTIIFFDEIDSLASSRSSGGSSVSSRVLSQLLTEMDGMASSEHTQVVVIGATNRPDVLDPALLRPGRFDRLLYVGLPDDTSRESILRIQLQRMPHSHEVANRLSEFVAKTDGMSGAELCAVCREAAILALQENPEAKQIGWNHITTALSKSGPRISSDMQRFYLDFQSKFGR